MNKSPGGKMRTKIESYGFPHIVSNVKMTFYIPNIRIAKSSLSKYFNYDFVPSSIPFLSSAIDVDPKSIDQCGRKNVNENGAKS